MSLVPTTRGEHSRSPARQVGHGLVEEGVGLQSFVGLLILCMQFNAQSLHQKEIARQARGSLYSALVPTGKDASQGHSRRTCNVYLTRSHDEMRRSFQIPARCGNLLFALSHWLARHVCLADVNRRIYKS